MGLGTQIWLVAVRVDWFQICYFGFSEGLICICKGQLKYYFLYRMIEVILPLGDAFASTPWSAFPVRKDEKWINFCIKWENISTDALDLHDINFLLLLCCLHWSKFFYRHLQRMNLHLVCSLLHQSTVWLHTQIENSGERISEIVATIFLEHYKTDKALFWQSFTFK